MCREKNRGLLLLVKYLFKTNYGSEAMNMATGSARLVWTTHRAMVLTFGACWVELHVATSQALWRWCAKFQHPRICRQWNLLFTLKAFSMQQTGPASDVLPQTVADVYNEIKNKHKIDAYCTVRTMHRALSIWSRVYQARNPCPESGALRPAWLQHRTLLLRVCRALLIKSRRRQQEMTMSALEPFRRHPQ